MRTLHVCLAAALALAGCSTLSNRSQRGEPPSAILKSAPTKPYGMVGRIDFHVEKWGKGEPSTDDFKPELVSHARAKGADAVMDLDWTLKGTAEAGIYHVVATAISYRVPPSAPAAQEQAQAAPAEVAVLTDPPARPFTKVSSLDFWVEKKTPGDGSLEEVLPEIKRQAGLSGAQAVINVHWTLAGPSGGRVYHVIATGIAYSGPATSAAPPEAATK